MICFHNKMLQLPRQKNNPEQNSADTTGIFTPGSGGEKVVWKYFSQDRFPYKQRCGIIRLFFLITGVPRSGIYIRTLWCKVLYTQTVRSSRSEAFIVLAETGKGWEKESRSQMVQCEALKRFLVFILPHYKGRRGSIV